MRTFFIVLLITLVSQSDEEANVLRVIDTFLQSVEKGDAELMRTVLTESGTSHYWNADTQETGEVSHREYIRDLGNRKEPVMEKVIETHVRVDGKEASVWAKYTLFRDGKLSHCGSEVFSLFKKENKWMIASIDFTVETGNCN